MFNVIKSALGFKVGDSNDKAFDVNTFSSEMSKHGVAKAHNFAVLVTPPNGMSDSLKRQIGNWLPLRIESINMPSRSLMTTEQRYHGPIRYMPYSVIFSPVTLTVILSENMVERDFFMAWQDAGISYRGTGASRDPNNRSDGKYDSNYYDEVTGSIEIQQYSDHAESSGGGLLGTALGVAQAVGLDPSPIVRPLGFDLGILPKEKPPSPRSKIILRECYPRTVNEVQMGWGSDEISKLQIEMIYFDIAEVYESSAKDANGVPGIGDFIRDGISGLRRIAPIVSGIKNGTLARNIKSGAGSQLGNAKANIKIF